MKVNTIIKEAVHLLPCITSSAIVFLFWELEYKALKKWKVQYITPFLSISWYEGRLQLWVFWINYGFVLRLNFIKWDGQTIITYNI